VRSTFDLLARGGVLEPQLARELAAAVGLRDRIAPEYGGLDLRRVFVSARDDLQDLDAFAAAVAAVLEGERQRSYRQRMPGSSRVSEVGASQTAIVPAVLRGTPVSANLACVRRTRSVDVRGALGFLRAAKPRRIR
jgi:hypothetical protein